MNLFTVVIFEIVLWTATQCDIKMGGGTRIKKNCDLAVDCALDKVSFQGFVIYRDLALTFVDQASPKNVDYSLDCISW